MSKSPTPRGNIGAWAAEAERSVAEERKQASQAAMVAAASGAKSSTLTSGFRDPVSRSSEPERWTRSAGHERQRLVVLESAKREVVSGSASEAPVKVDKPNPFGAARPREEVLAERGFDWKKLDMEIDAKKAVISSRPTGSGSSKPWRSQSSHADKGAVKPRPKINPFGDAKPTEDLVKGKGKIDLEFEHRLVDRPEKNLKEEVEQLKKAPESSGCYQTKLHDSINQEVNDLELLVHQFHDNVQFSRKPIESRQGSGRSGRGTGLSEKIPCPPTVYEVHNAGDLMERPRSRGRIDAWARPSDLMGSPRLHGGVDECATPNEQLEKPRSRGWWRRVDTAR